MSGGKLCTAETVYCTVSSWAERLPAVLHKKISAAPASATLGGLATNSAGLLKAMFKMGNAEIMYRTVSSRPQSRLTSWCFADLSSSRAGIFRRATTGLLRVRVMSKLGDTKTLSELSPVSLPAAHPKAAIAATVSDLDNLLEAVFKLGNTVLLKSMGRIKQYCLLRSSVQCLC